jgi:hypothetical protein
MSGLFNNHQRSKAMSLFISYNREQKDFADKIENSVRAICPVLRDINDIAPWGSIEEFMNRIRQADYAVLLISETYLKSVNCMYEACQLYRDINWKSRRMYLVLGNADQNVYNVANHEQFISYWQEKKAVLEEKKNKLPGESIDSITAEIKRVSEILLLMGEFLKDIRDANNPQPQNDSEAIDAIIAFVTQKTATETATIEASSLRPKLLKKTLLDAGFDDIFKEVMHTHTLPTVNDSVIRMFHLQFADNQFSLGDMHGFLRKNLGRYVFSRAKIDQLVRDEHGDEILTNAIERLKAALSDADDLGDEFGEIVLYAILEKVLEAPKLFSKIDFIDSGSGLSATDSGAVHLLSPNDTSGKPSYQMVWGKSHVMDDIKDAIDAAFDRINIVKAGITKQMRVVVDQMLLSRHYDRETAEALSDIIINRNKGTVTTNNSFSVFLGYTIGLKPDRYTPEEFERQLMARMDEDIKEHAGYIVHKIKDHNLGMHSFYIYVIPLNDAVADKRNVMDALLAGRVDL